MASTEINAERLLGKRVVDSAGEKVGRIEDLRGEDRDGDLVVTEYHTGGYAMLERLAAITLGGWVLRLLGRRPAYAISWDQMDLSDPERPRTCCPRGELRQRELK
jgi:hypothetical protein